MNKSAHTPANDLTYMASVAMQRLASMAIFRETCPGHQALGLLSGKWSVLLIYAMSQGARRYGELQRIMPDISAKMLTHTLRELERYQFIERFSFAEAPPRVEYALSELGLSVVEPLALLCQWANEHIEELRSIRDNLSTGE